MRSITTLGLAATLLATLAPPALAGGWWTFPQLEHLTPALGIGETTTVGAQVMFSTADEAVAARTDGAWYAYLVRGIDTTGLQAAMSQPQPDDWWTTPQETIQLGLLRFGPNDSNLAHASVTFVVPDVEEGAYDLMFCDRGCSESLADVVPLQSIYVGDPAAALMMRESRLATDDLMGELDHVGSRVEQLDGEVGRIGDDLAELAARVEKIALAEQPPDGGSGDTLTWLMWAGWFVAGIAAARAWSNRRRGVTNDTEALEPEADTQIIVGDSSAEPEFVTGR